MTTNRDTARVTNEEHTMTQSGVETYGVQPGDAHHERIVQAIEWAEKASESAMRQLSKTRGSIVDTIEAERIVDDFQVAALWEAQELASLWMNVIRAASRSDEVDAMITVAKSMADDLIRHAWEIGASQSSSLASNARDAAKSNANRDFIRTAQQIAHFLGRAS